MLVRNFEVKEAVNIGGYDYSQFRKHGNPRLTREFHCMGAKFRFKLTIFVFKGLKFSGT